MPLNRYIDDAQQRLEAVPDDGKPPAQWDRITTLGIAALALEPLLKDLALLVSEYDGAAGRFLDDRVRTARLVSSLRSITEEVDL